MVETERLDTIRTALSHPSLPPSLFPAAREAGWHVDENKNEVLPLPAPPAQGEPLGEEEEGREGQGEGKVGVSV